MGRKKKLVNNTTIPQYAIERFTRCIFDDVRAYFATEEGQRAYALWEAEQAEIKESSCPCKSKQSTAFAVSSEKLRTGSKEYAAWEEQENKKRAAISGGSAALYGLLFSGATGFGFWPYGCAVGKIGLLIPLEINK